MEFDSISKPAKMTRLYRVDTPHGRRLIEAKSREAAVAHAIKTERMGTSADLAQSHEIHQLAKMGIEIEVAGKLALSDDTMAMINQGHLDV